MKRLLSKLGLVLLALSGCYGSYYYDPYYYDYVYYDPYWYGYDAAYAYTWVDPYGVYYFAQTSTIDLNAAAGQIAARAGTYFTPAGCLTATASGTTVQYTFSQCSGGFGLKTITGSATVALSEDDGQLVLTASSSDLRIDGEPFILDLTATASRAGAQRTVTINSRSRAPDQVDSREALSTLTWEQGSGCYEMNGQGGSTRGDLSATSTVTGYRRCTNSSTCPSAGEVTVQGPGGAFSAAFDGSGNLQVSAPDGSGRRYDLQCQ